MALKELESSSAACDLEARAEEAAQLLIILKEQTGMEKVDKEELEAMKQSINKAKDEVQSLCFIADSMCSTLQREKANLAVL